MKELPVRKQNRLKGYDYSQSGLYFITICVKDRYELLSRIVGGVVHNAPPELSEYGRIIETILLSGGNPKVRLDKYIIMPNHIHLILTVYNDKRGVVDNAPYKSLISTFVRSIKTMTTKQIGFSLWQRSFHDHIIRNETEYREICQYIDENPVKWEKDEYHT